jgi:hypothetical protein
VWCALTENKVISPFLFEETTVTGDTFLDVMDNNALCHVPVGTVFQSHGTPLQFSRHVPAFLSRGFSDLG